MGITSFYYLVFLGIVILLYFILPIKVRWLVILAADFFFVYTNNSRRAICVMLLMIFTAYFSGILIEKLCDKNRIRKIVLLISIVIEAGALLLLKETVFLNHFTNLFGANMPIEAFRIYAPLGMSYFTLTMISYVLETYWMTQPAQKNIFKFFTYAAFFPALTSGPIMNYVESGDNILTGHRFDYKNLCFGSQRILWGFFKKIVVAERLAVVVDFIYADPVNYNGIYIWVAGFCKI